MVPENIRDCPWVTVKEVLALYPQRKLSWAYTQIRAVKDCTGRRFVNWRDWDEFGPSTPNYAETAHRNRHN